MAINKDWLVKKVKKNLFVAKAARLVLYTFGMPLKEYNINKKELKKLKDAYYGERCFIVGNGPSLTPEDLDKIKGEYSFAANAIYRMFDKTDWRPTFYCVQDQNVLKNTEDDIFETSKSIEHTFIRMYSYKNVPEDFRKSERIKWVPIWFKVLPDEKVPFTDKADRFVYDGATVTYMAMQLAAYMGFTEIYLIGVDHSFPFMKNMEGEVKVVDTNIVAHFYETKDDNFGKDAAANKANSHKVVTNAYKAAEKASRVSGKFRIFNATRGGKLEVYERVDLDDIV